MLLDNVLHDDSVYGNVPSGQHVFVEKFLFHELVKYFLFLVSNRRQKRSVVVYL